MSSTCGDCIAGELYGQPIEPGCIGCKYSLRRKRMTNQDLLKEARELMLHKKNGGA